MHSYLIVVYSFSYLACIVMLVKMVAIVMLKVVAISIHKGMVYALASYYIVYSFSYSA